MRGLDVIRTVWLAVLCSIGLGAMVGISAGPPMPPTNGGTSAEQTIIAVGSSPDTLTKADKLEIAYVPFQVALEPVMPDTPVSDKTSPQPLSLTIPKIVSRHLHDHAARKSATVSPTRRIKIQEPKNNKNVDRAKTTVDLRPCRRPEGFAGLLRALNLSPGCDA
jgi:hypothetical protein